MLNLLIWRHLFCFHYNYQNQTRQLILFVRHNFYQYISVPDNNHTMSDSEQKSAQIPPYLAVLGMVNGMIGGLILLLPVFALDAGYIITLVVILITCIFSYYSCYLCLIHLGDQADLDYAIFRHFNGNRAVKIFYDLCVWSNLILVDMLYFGLITIQWEGLIPPHNPSWINSTVNAVVLFILVFVLKYFEFGTSLMAYGIISIISYLVFLIWAVSTYNQGHNQSQMKPFGTGAVTLAAAMGQAFSIQSFFIPVVKKAPNPHKYTQYTLIAYIAGGLAYYYIAYAGSTAIWHRKNYKPNFSEQTIENYFDPGQWEVDIIELIYLIHLYSVFPQFMLISKKRFFGVIGLQQSERGKVTIPQIIYIAVMVGICFLIGLFQVDIGDIIDINGAVIGFIFIYFIPALLHLKCLYFSKGKRPVPEAIELYEQPAEDGRSDRTLSIGVEEEKGKEKDIQIAVQPPKRDDRHRMTEIRRSLLSEQSSVRQSENEMSLPIEDVEYAHFYCNVDLKTYSKFNLVLDFTLIIAMVGLGVFIMINGLATVF